MGLKTCQVHMEFTECEDRHTEGESDGAGRDGMKRGTTARGWRRDSERSVSEVRIRQTMPTSPKPSVSLSQSVHFFFFIFPSFPFASSSQRSQSLSYAADFLLVFHFSFSFPSSFSFLFLLFLLFHSFSLMF